MTPQTTPRPIRRAPEPRTPYVPPDVARVLMAIRPWRHVLRPGMAELLAISIWADLQAMTDLRRLADEVQARLMRQESRRFLIGPISSRDRLGDVADEPRANYSALWMPAAGAPRTAEGRTP